MVGQAALVSSSRNRLTSGTLPSSSPASSSASAPDSARIRHSLQEGRWAYPRETLSCSPIWPAVKAFLQQHHVGMYELSRRRQGLAKGA